MSTAIPYSSIGDNLRAALSAAETSRNDPGVLANLSERIRGDQQLPRVPASVQIARMILCVPSHALSRETKELRLAIRLERHYTRQQLFTIYANMAPFGQNLLGVQEASQTIFHKDSRELTLAQAALLAGLMRAPSYYSPFKHADRALQRRNEVIDAMVANERITQSDGVRAKASNLDVAARDTSPTK